MAKYKYYAVAIGKVKTPTIYNQWEPCKKATSGTDSTFKSFTDLQEAVDFIIAVVGETDIILKLNQDQNIKRVERTAKGPGKSKKVSAPVK